MVEMDIAVKIASGLITLPFLYVSYDTISEV